MMLLRLSRLCLLRRTLLQTPTPPTPSLRRVLRWTAQKATLTATASAPPAARRHKMAKQAARPNLT